MRRAVINHDVTGTISRMSGSGANATTIEDEIPIPAIDTTSEIIGKTILRRNQC